MLLVRLEEHHLRRTVRNQSLFRRISEADTVSWMPLFRPLEGGSSYLKSLRLKCLKSLRQLCWSSPSVRRFRQSSLRPSLYRPAGSTSIHPSMSRNLGQIQLLVILYLNFFLSGKFKKKKKKKKKN